MRNTYSAVIGSIVSKMFSRADDLEEKGQIDAARELRRFADQLQGATEIYEPDLT